MRLALFDLDNTLLAGDSDFEWAQFLIGKMVLDRELYEAKNRSFYDQYRSGTLDINTFLDFQLKPLSRHPRHELDAWLLEFTQNRILPIITRKARTLVQSHIEDGDLTAIITATNRFVTAPIAAEFGVKHLIATEPEERDGEFTGKVAGTPCFRAGKVACLERWLLELGQKLTGFDESWFFSDSLNDLPLLERVTHPVAVDPDETLRAHALEKKWQVISLR
ncbi:MAG TPA: HAD family hydrolase [Burkholderiales bacterium]|jgi:HAD superfamily hydrolase (TIGR01490 family)|nr:HAD family hydrolase [Burkholderiales bacterium]